MFLAHGCTQAPASASVQASGFDADRAWKDLEQLVAIGPRQSGTEGALKTRAYLKEQLVAAGLEPVEEAFSADTPAGALAMANLIADLKPAHESKNESWVLFCTHYDTKRLPNFVGANDGGSGTAVLLELARSVARGPRGSFGYRFLFLDGEEAVNRAWVDPDNRYGSRHHAQQLKASGHAARFKACVLLDMIGDKDLAFDQEGYSDPKIYGVFSNAARDLGFAAHLTAKRGAEVIDDHLIFMGAGIRSVDLIDFNYGPDHAWWHTEDDTLEHCSKQSLDIIGRVVLHALPELEKHLSGH